MLVCAGAVLLAIVVGATAVSSTAAAQGPNVDDELNGVHAVEQATGTLAEDITQRDVLIASQEALLNVYRCRFEVDTHVVPGGCSNGRPNASLASSSVFVGTPTKSHLNSRNQLIASQEALLNVYRCQFEVDAHVVPGGCSNNKPVPISLITEVGDERVRLEWGPGGSGGSPIIRWEYRISTEGNNHEGVWSEVPGGANVFGYTVSNLESGVPYRFQVRVFSQAGAGKPIESDLIILYTVPDAPEELTTEIDNESVTLNWISGNTGGSPIIGWQYRIKTANDIYSEWMDIPGRTNIPSHTVSDLNNGVSYQFEVRASNQFGAGAAARTSLVTPMNPVAPGNSVTSNSSVTSRNLGAPEIPLPPSNDREVLMVLYFYTNGNNWKRSDNWLTDKPLNTWYGVTADESDYVTHLELDNNNLLGSIPKELGTLSKMIELRLNDNQLSGPIPKELGNLGSLSEFLHNRPYGCRFSASGPDYPIDYSTLTKCPFQKIYLQNNQLSGSIPPELSKLTSLQALALNSNQLSGSIPSELSQVTYLVFLWLDDNQLSGSIPSELGQLTNLMQLKLGNNELSGSIPPEIGQSTHLRYLWLHNNELSGSIPPELGQLVRLKQLYLFNNELSGSIPVEVGQLTRLVDLYVENNQLSGILPASLGQLTNLENLKLNDNRLSGRIPTELGELANLRQLMLSNNRLSGYIPATLGKLTDLIHLWLHDNKLSGHIPETLGELTNLVHLWVFNNEIQGKIPKTLGKLSNLQQLKLNNNDLSGNIPVELSKLVSLQELYLYNNRLSGAIPPELGELNNLTGLNLGGNKLSGPIPVQWAIKFPASSF